MSLLYGPGNLKNSTPCVSYCLKSSLALVPWENRHLWRAVYALAVGHLFLWGLEVFCDREEMWKFWWWAWTETAQNGRVSRYFCKNRLSAFCQEHSLARHMGALCSAKCPINPVPSVLCHLGCVCPYHQKRSTDGISESGICEQAVPLSTEESGVTRSEWNTIAESCLGQTYGLRTRSISSSKLLVCNAAHLHWALETFLRLCLGCLPTL